jgi:hypothetical protein
MQTIDALCASISGRPVDRKAGVVREPPGDPGQPRTM